MDDAHDSAKTTRREFIRSAAATAAVTAAATRVAKSSVYSLAPARVIGANDKIIVAHIGLGQQGRAHVKLLKENSTEGLKNNTEQVACCDIYVRRVNMVQKTLELKDAQCFNDYRKLLENKDINAVWVTTSDQWHAAITIDALKAGKHVYCEKPLARSVEEAYAIYDAVKETKMVFQIGSQGCSDQKWHVAGKAVREGKVGQLISGQGSYCRNSVQGEWNDYPIDADAGPKATGEAYVNWDVFRRGAEPAEWDPDRYFRWRKYWAYGSGPIGDLMPHRLHPLLIAMNMPLGEGQGYPIRVSATGGLFIPRVNPDTKKPDREVPDYVTLSVAFNNDTDLLMLTSTINEQGLQDMVRGNKATIFFGGAGVEIRPERVWAEEIDGSTEPVPGEGEQINIHQRDFLDAIRNNRTPNANIDLALRVQLMVSMCEMSYRQGKTMHFDPATRKVIA